LRFLSYDAPNLDEIREILRDIVADDKRAVEVIQGLRAMLKKGELRREPVDPNALVSDVVRLLRSDMLNAGVIYTTELTPNCRISAAFMCSCSRCC
jgi:two-component system sensor kinase FixL